MTFASTTDNPAPAGLTTETTSVAKFVQRVRISIRAKSSRPVRFGIRSNVLNA